MRVVYLVGKFRAPTAWAIEENIRKAERLALKTWLAGFAVICPHTNTRFFHGAGPDQLWLDGDIEIMLRCDAVLIEPSQFEDSSGSKYEVARAVQKRIPVFDNLDDLCYHAEVHWPGERWVPPTVYPA